MDNVQTPTTLALSTRVPAGSRCGIELGREGRGTQAPPALLTRRPEPTPGAPLRTRLEQAARQARLPAASPPGLPSRRGHSPCTLTFCSSAEAASGTSADILLLLQRDAGRRCDHRVAEAARPPHRLRPARPRSPSARSGRLRPRKWPPPYDDTEPRSARQPATAARRSPAAPPAPRPYLPYPASPALRRRSTSFLPSKVAARALPHIRLPDASWEL